MAATFYAFLSRSARALQHHCKVTACVRVFEHTLSFVSALPTSSSTLAPRVHAF